MPNLNEFYLFREYTAAVKKFCKDTVYLSRFPAEQNWEVYFETIDQAYAKRIIPMINGKNPGPNGILELDDFTENTNEAMNGYHYGMVKTGTKYNAEISPLVYTINYTLTFFTSTRADADIILYQLLTAAPKTRKYCTTVNNNWCEIFVYNPSDDTALEIEEAKAKIHRFSVKLTIPRAYINYPMQIENTPEINEVNITAEVVEDGVYV